MADRKKLITMRGVTKGFGPLPNQVFALRGIDLDVYEGEVLMLMGPSGSGKTTLLSIMGCILTPTAGSVNIDGLEVTKLGVKHMSKVRLDKLGFIFQDYNLFPTLTALENILVALDLRDISRSESREAGLKALEAVGLGAKIDAYPETLSGGQKQRLAIARSLAGSPRIILADEPTAALDSENGKLVVELMASLAKESQRSVVIVTHDPRALQFADRIVTIEDGLLSTNPSTPQL